LANEQFDVTIIGAGPGGYVAAIRAAQLGLKVALVEKDKRLGGTCGLRGCIPTKQLLMSAHIYEQMQHAADFGVQASGIQLAFADVQKRKDKVVMKNAKGVEYLMKKNKVTVFKGSARLALPGKIEVTAEDGKKESVQTKNIIIATGSIVRPIAGFETDGKQVVNSDHILELTDVPKSLIVMGCGAVGVEFASVYSRFGAETTIVELLPRLVPLEDEEVSKELERSFRKRGIKSQVDTKLDKLEKTDKGVVVTGKTSKGEEVNWKQRCFWSPSAACLTRKDLVWKERRSKSKRVSSKLTNISKPAKKAFMQSVTWCRRLCSHTSPRRKASSPSSTLPERIRDRLICGWFRIVRTAIRKLVLSV